MATTKMSPKRKLATAIKLEMRAWNKLERLLKKEGINLKKNTRLGIALYTWGAARMTIAIANRDLNAYEKEQQRITWEMEGRRETV